MHKVKFKSAFYCAKVTEMFCDETEIFVSAGNGGGGLMSFRREKYIPKGGPDGGDGGRGGDVIIRADENIDTLLELHTKKKFSADNGERGGVQNKHGKNAEDLILKVPVGTQIFDKESGETLADLTQHEDELVATVGGRGGYGNAHFTSSTRQAPRFAELGEPGENREIRLEVRLVADVGIIGLPSAGKSTFIASITSARPKIGNYPFTTLVPNLGVAKLTNGRELIFCDIPGLIEGAHEGKGLGHEFLRHISRNRVLIHLIDAGSENPAKNYKIIREELEKYDPNLSQKPEIIALSKSDLFGDDTEILALLKNEFSEQIGIPENNIFVFSSATGFGKKEILESARKKVSVEKERERTENPIPKTEKTIFRPHLSLNPKAFELEKIRENTFQVSGVRIEQIVVMSDLTNEEANFRVCDVLRKMGIERKLLNAGAKKGDLIMIGQKSIEFRPNIFANHKKILPLLKNSEEEE